MIGSPSSETEEKVSGDSYVSGTSYVLMLENRPSKAPAKQVQWPHGRRHLPGLQGRSIARLANSMGRAGAERDEFSCLPVNVFTGHSLEGNRHWLGNTLVMPSRLGSGFAF